MISYRVDKSLFAIQTRKKMSDQNFQRMIFSPLIAVLYVIIQIKPGSAKGCISS